LRSELKKDEKLLIVIRQHWINLVLPILFWVAVVVLSFWFITDPVIALIISLVTALYPLFLFLKWKHNLWAVTNMRVIDENGFISRYSKESPLDKINNVEYDQSLAGRIFGYGDVRIQTAAEMGDTTYKFIHHPKTLKDTIAFAQEEYKRLATASQANLLAEAIKANMNSTFQPGINNQNTSSSAAVNPSPSPASVAGEIEKLFALFKQGAITQEEYLEQKARLLKTS
jgi:uncharacterized membrane protein YdbT with pleckstrin-like domain